MITTSAPLPVAPTFMNMLPVGRGTVSVLRQLGISAKVPKVNIGFAYVLPEVPNPKVAIGVPLEFAIVILPSAVAPLLAAESVA